MNMRPGPSKFPRPDCPKEDWEGGSCAMGTNPGRTHRFYTGDPVVEFGFGLSYTSWEYTPVATPPAVLELRRVQAALAAHAASGRTFLRPARGRPWAGGATDGGSAPSPLIAYALNVTNTGEVDSDHVVPGFIVAPGAGEDGAELQRLFDFTRVHVAAGETRTVWLYPSLADLTRVEAKEERRGAAGEVGASGERVVRVAVGGSFEVRFGIQSSVESMGGYATHRFTLQ